MDNEMNTELVCVMASLGYYDEDEYYMGTDCIESLKDLIRFLRKEDDSCNIRRQMGSAQLVQRDLLPMLIHLGDNEELIDIAIRLLVNLTSPVDICFNKHAEVAEEEGEKDKVTNTFQTKKMEVTSHLQKYKKAFTSEKALAAIGSQLGRILQMEREERGENELLLFERLLLLLRNILHVPSSPEDEQRTDDDASLHDQVLWSMHINGIDELLIYISSSAEEGRWTMHVMEIIFLMFREQNPVTLGKTSKDKSESEKAAIARDMMLAKEKEKAVAKAGSKKVYNSRHSRFGGTYWVKNMKGIGQANTLVHHKHVTDPNDISFDEKKYRRRVPKRLQPLKPNEVEKRSTLKIRLFLKEFCMKFLELSYNLIMRQVKDNVISKKTQENDDTYYLWAMRFFMEFNRAHSFKVEYVSETLNLNTFHYILKQLNTYYDQFLMHKRGGWEPWATRLHKALQTYKELLTYISNMDQSHDTVLKDASAVIKNNIFYHEEYRNIFIILLRHYVISRHTSKFLSDLIETFHVFVKLLEKFCKTKGSLLVASKQKVKKKKSKPSEGSSSGAMTAEQLEDLWENDLAPALSGLLQGYETVPDNAHSPFDHSSDVPVDEQMVNAMAKIQDLLRSGQAGQAVALLRASRECWPDEAQLGSQISNPEEEFALFRNLLTMELVRPTFEEAPEEAEMEDEEEEASSVRSVEREFHLTSFLFSLAAPAMMKPYCMQLKHFKENSPLTNHAVIKMMHRVAVDMKFPEMFYQLSLFITFKEIMELKMSLYKELDKFARYIIYKFNEAALANPRLYVEALFWKTTGDCYQISSREAPQKTMTSKWTIDEELELKTLYDQYKDSENVVDDIVGKIGEQGRTRKQIINKLVALQCVQNAKELPGVVQHGGNWSYEEEEELKTLFDQFKESEDVVEDILKNIRDPSRTRQKIINKLVRLKLIDKGKDLPKAPKPKWSEEQTEELYRLYEEYKDSDDVIANIMVSMSFKKSKVAIMKHLVVSGKVLDKRTLYKKKSKKSGKKSFKDMVSHDQDDQGRKGRARDEWASEPGEQKIYDEWSDEEDGGPSNDNANNEFKSSDENSENEDDDPSTDIISLVQKVKPEFPQQIIWLQNRLRRAADDRDEDSDWYPMPLLTMTEEDDLALQNKDFKKLLLAIGIRAPVDEQEMFWRIGERLTPAILRRFSNDLDKSIKERSNTEIYDNEVSNNLENSLNDGNDSCKDASTSKRFKRQFLSSESDDSDDGNDLDKSIKEIPNTKIREDEASNNLDSSVNDDNSLCKAAPSKRGKRQFVSSESDDSDDGNENKVVGKLMEPKQVKRKYVLEDEDSDADENKQSDIDDSVPLHKKRKRVLDDEESGTDENKMSDTDDSVPKLPGTSDKASDKCTVQTLDIDDDIPLHDLLENRETRTEDTTSQADTCNPDVLRDSTNFDNISTEDTATDKKRPSAPGPDLVTSDDLS